MQLDKNASSLHISSSLYQFGGGVGLFVCFKLLWKYRILALSCRSPICVEAKTKKKTAADQPANHILQLTTSGK